MKTSLNIVSVTHKSTNIMSPSIPWQLRMFQKTLKKKLRLKELSKLLGSIPAGNKCLLITCGDNNGGINYYLRKMGGSWKFAELENKSIPEMSRFLNQEVAHVRYDNLPFENNSFDLVITIDCHEHIENPETLTREIHRITKNKGRVIFTVPSGQKTKAANILKNAVGMTKEKYGHVREGFSLNELGNLMMASKIVPVKKRTFSRFFTELLELGINFLYVKVLAKKNKTMKNGTIAPATKVELMSVEKTYKVYSLVYPFFKIISALDYLLFFTKGYVVIIEGEKTP